MKQFALSLALLTSVATVCAVELEVELTHNGKTNTEILNLDLAREVVVHNDAIVAVVHCTQDANTVLVDATITERKADNAEVVLHDGPVIALTLHEDGSIAHVEERTTPALSEDHKSMLTVRTRK